MNNDNSRQKSFECNTFVTYLNSLQRIEATNANSIAESQAKDPNFTNIIVSHPLKNKIIKELCDPKGVHVILTGHAGDGKSTIALEIFKELKNIQSNKALTEDIKAKEVIQRQEKKQ
ncbi:hypothetical protein EOM81_02295, partial [bacterium]|nr:hypothetical protein [bacterium]